MEIYREQGSLLPCTYIFYGGWFCLRMGKGIIMMFLRPYESRVWKRPAAPSRASTKLAGAVSQLDNFIVYPADHRSDEGAQGKAIGKSDKAAQKSHPIAYKVLAQEL